MKLDEKTQHLLQLAKEPGFHQKIKPIAMPILIEKPIPQKIKLQTYWKIFFNNVFPYIHISKNVYGTFTYKIETP